MQGNQAQIASESNRPHYILGFVVIISLLSAAAIGIHRLTYISVWYDEYLTIQTIQFDWRTILLGEYPREFHPMLYFLTMKFWTTLFGSSEIILRLFSLMFTLVNLVLIARLAYILAGWRVAAAMTILFAFHPLYVYYGTMIRMYPFWLFFCLLALLGYFSYTTSARAPITWLVVTLLALTAAMYTHYLGVLIGLILCVLSITQLVIRRDTRQWKFLATVMLSGILYVPCVIYVFVEQTQFYAEEKVPFSEAVDASLFIITLSGSISWAPQVLAVLAFLGGFFLLHQNGQNVLAWQILGGIAISIALLVFANMQGMQLAVRYLLHINLLAGFLIASTFLHSSTRTALLINALGGTLIALFMFQTVRAEIAHAYLHPDWEQVSEVIEEHSAPDEPLVIMGWDATPVEFYLPDKHILTSYDLTNELSQESHPSSYIILHSQYARQLPFLEPSVVLYEHSQWQVRVTRWNVPEDLEQ